MKDTWMKRDKKKMEITYGIKEKLKKTNFKSWPIWNSYMVSRTEELKLIVKTNTKN